MDSAGVCRRSAGLECINGIEGEGSIKLLAPLDGKVVALSSAYSGFLPLMIRVRDHDLWISSVLQQEQYRVPIDLEKTVYLATRAPRDFHYRHLLIEILNTWIRTCFITQTYPAEAIAGA